MDDSAGHMCRPISSAHHRFLHAAAVQRSKDQETKGRPSSATDHWVVPLFTRPCESASRIANPAPEQATQADLPSAGRVQQPNSEAIAAVVTRIQHRGSAPAAALARPDGGRIDKRKRRQPTRSPLAYNIPDSASSPHERQQHSEQPGFHTVRMSFVDEYQRNPTAYSRALMDSERPGTHDSSSGNSHSPSRASSHNADLQNMARRASFPHARHSAPASPPKAQSAPVLRKSISATIHRLFPTLREPMEMLSAASRIGARSASPSSGSHRARLAASAGAQALRHLTLPPPPPLLSLAIGDIRTVPNYYGHRRQSQPAAGAMASLIAAPSATSSGTSSGSSTPRSGISPDKSGILSGAFDLDDELSREIFALRPGTSSCSVKWTKAAPMDVSGYPKAELLAAAERECCSILRLYPEQYLIIKQSLVRAGRTLPRGTFKKRDAQKLCRVDVNKTSKVFEWFCKLEWIPQASTRLSHSSHQLEVEHEHGQQMLLD
ncbi:hypothetical protein GGF38_002102 [Coemansia sp. RSA 25]|nr:hypothetical protein GGF38_002102 [Coemansia sp. RSA 25]